MSYSRVNFTLPSLWKKRRETFIHCTDCMYDYIIYNFDVLKHIFDSRTLHMAALNDRLHFHSSGVSLINGLK